MDAWLPGSLRRSSLSECEILLPTDRWKDRTDRLYKFVPFGGGIRPCKGTASATMEMKIVIAS